MNAKLELTVLILSAITAGVILKFGFAGSRDFENAALGTLTAQVLAQNEGGQNIHTIKQADSDIQQMMSHSSEFDEVTFILGNSQTHSINQKEPGQIVYPELLQKAWPQRCFLTNSLPNANLQEFHVVLKWWNERLNIQTVLLPVFMDDLREDGLRRDFLTGLIRESYSYPSPQDDLEREWKATLEGFQAPANEGTASSEGIETPQEISEKAINEWLGDRSEIWMNRPNARGDFFMKLYQWRNSLFGIKATTKRKMLPARLNKNIEALEKTLRWCDEEKIQVLLYIPPIRTDVEVPYDLSEYRLFKSRIEELALSHPLTQFRDFDSIVPGQFWGLKASTSGDEEPELDFMHFQFRGHQILADSLSSMLKGL